FFSAVMLRITIPYLTFRSDVDFLHTKQSIIHISIWRWSFYVHVFTSTLVLFIGGLQFIPALINRKPLHRLLGKAYVIIILFITGPASWVMACYANGGIYAKTSFLVLSTLWMLFTLLAYLYVRQKRILLHSDFMIRSYALTLSAITLRTYALVLPHFIHIYGRDEYILIAWLSWVPNLIIAEMIIRLQKVRREKFILSLQ
ncbi:MAG: hypothetical protein JWO06_2308, partial [Bacteroidota bacterium]|nr:hypothetical protein [Bacteroidota bacterium]